MDGFFSQLSYAGDGDETNKEGASSHANTTTTTASNNNNNNKIFRGSMNCMLFISLVGLDMACAGLWLALRVNRSSSGSLDALLAWTTNSSGWFRDE
jgi:hypothetical protein